MHYHTPPTSVPGQAAYSTQQAARGTQQAASRMKMKQALPSPHVLSHGGAELGELVGENGAGGGGPGGEEGAEAVAIGAHPSRLRVRVEGRLECEETGVPVAMGGWVGEWVAPKRSEQRGEG